MTAAGRAGLALADDALIARAADGDAAAFDSIIRPRLDRLFRMAVAITRQEADARDAVQEACVAAWRELPRLRDHGRFDSWLAQIVVNACRIHLRRQRRVTVREIAVEVQAETPAEPRSSTGGHGDSIAEVEAIRRAFARLGADERALLVLHYQEERPLAEIAAITGAPVGTVKWRLSNARKALDRALEVERR